MASKINYLSNGKGGHPGEGLDIDGNQATCAPVDDCSGGIDNQASGLAEQLAQFFDVDAELVKGLEQGSIVVLLEAISPDTSGTTFKMSMHRGEPVEDKDVCDFQAELCDYNLKPGQESVYGNALIQNGKLTAGGQGYSGWVSCLVLPLSCMPFGMEQPTAWELFFEASDMHLAGLVNPDDCEHMAVSQGIMAGALVKQDVIEQIELLDDTDLPVSKEMMINLIDLFLKPDIDTDGDGELDAISFGLKFSSIPAEIVGISY